MYCEAIFANLGFTPHIESGSCERAWGGKLAIWLDRSSGAEALQPGKRYTSGHTHGVADRPRPLRSGTPTARSTKLVVGNGKFVLWMGWCKLAKTRSADNQAGELAFGHLFPAERWAAVETHFGFSPRQLEIVRQVCLCRQNKQIATELGITTDTVKMHLKEVYHKVGVATRVGLVVMVLLVAERLTGKQRRK